MRNLIKSNRLLMILSISSSLYAQEYLELLKLFPWSQFHPLVMAIYSESPKITRLLLACRLNPNFQDRYGNTPLHRAIHHKQDEIAELLINAHPDLNIQDVTGKAPLHWAVRKGNIKIVRLLIKSQVNLDLQETNGWTALHWATHKGHVEIAKLLVSAGANLNIKNKDNNTAIDLARGRGIPSKEIETFLIKKYKIKEFQTFLMHQEAGLRKPKDKSLLEFKNKKAD